MTSSSYTLSLNSSFFTSIKAFLVAKNGLTRMISISLSSSMSKTLKYVGKMNLSTFTSTSSIISLGCFSDQSASCRVTIVGLASPSSNLLKIDRGIKLMLALRSHNALSKTTLPMVRGIVKLPRYFSF